jgi:hypothetical protein
MSQVADSQLSSDNNFDNHYDLLPKIASSWNYSVRLLHEVHQRTPTATPTHMAFTERT